MKRLWFLAAAGLGLAVLLMSGGCEAKAGDRSGASQTLKINGSTTVNLPAAEAAEILRAEKGMNIQVDTQGGSSGGISMLGDGLVQIGMSSKHISDDDRNRYPNVSFTEVQIGEDAVALIVSRDVWESGVRSLTRQQTRDIYEGRITNWKELGGKDQRIVFFNKEPGRGTWEVFAHWLYGNPKTAPAVSFPEVGGNEETRNKVASTQGAISQLSSSWADGKTVFALGLMDDDGQVIEPTAANIATHTYPMSRPLFLLTNGQPAGEAKVFIDFVLSPRGQELVRKHGYLSLDQLRE
ncbi:MAG: phosphate ABC transporter substrate-binding protein [Phycisphaerales bacterium]|nr:phosphate ABC transporter substrate-binding protein [Phycisphaerales bacterium]